MAANNELEEIFSLLEGNGFVTTKDITRILGIPARRALKHAAELREAGRIFGLRVGGSWSHWHPEVADAKGTPRLKEQG